MPQRASDLLIVGSTILLNLRCGSVRRICQVTSQTRVLRHLSQAAMRRMEYMCRYRTNASLRRVIILSSSGSRWSNPINSV